MLLGSGLLQGWLRELQTLTTPLMLSTVGYSRPLARLLMPDIAQLVLQGEPIQFLDR